MGAADIVPGVSGGTIALITGIYLRLLSALGALPTAAVTLLRQRQWGPFWQRIEGNFLLLLGLGILSSIFLLANLITWLLLEHTVLLWSFFTGLILAAIVFLARQISQWSFLAGLLLVLGALVAWSITRMTPVEPQLSYWVIFGGGALAISAMILPGISGSFILLLLGLYGPVLQAVRDLDFALLLVFAAGCLTGLLGFARLVAEALRQFPGQTLALLTGFMIGALPAVWPWQQAVSGDNLTPFDYAQLTGEPHLLPWALMLVLLGAVMVLVLEKTQRVGKVFT
ncbi:MAG: DUF368 domain-containing protein [Halomonadaceae bacterium]|nr:MAG: DUF368 domain-containing protein [Halomonadaceae bacterium]